MVIFCRVVSWSLTASLETHMIFYLHVNAYLGQGSDHIPLEWTVRHNIALGVARGLAYLHHDCNPRIIHRDISTSNILLDANLQAQITDFGLARILGLNDTHVTATVAGTFGYIAPGIVLFHHHNYK